MNKRGLILMLVALISAPAIAAQGGGFFDPEATESVRPYKGGFSGPQGSVVSVRQAKTMRDDAWVILRGKIEKRIGEEDYLFRDETGTMTVEIDPKRWEGQTVSPSDTVELQGKLDKDFSSLELEVKQIRKIL